MEPSQLLPGNIYKIIYKTILWSRLEEPGIWGCSWGFYLAMKTIPKLKGRNFQELEFNHGLQFLTLALPLFYPFFIINHSSEQE